MRASVLITILILLAGAGPATQPSNDPAIDWLMDQATTAPATQEAATSQPASPLTSKTNQDDGRAGSITLSSGDKISGSISTTPEKPLRIWDDQDKEYHDIMLSQVKSATAEIVWERDEKEWHFKESGSDIKEYSGKTYPARETVYKIELVDGSTIRGGVVAPIFIAHGDESKMLVLHKRDKGEVGQTLAQLIYIRKIEFTN